MKEAEEKAKREAAREAQKAQVQAGKAQERARLQAEKQAERDNQRAREKAIREAQERAKRQADRSRVESSISGLPSGNVRLPPARPYRLNWGPHLVRLRTASDDIDQAADKHEQANRVGNANANSPILLPPYPPRPPVPSLLPSAIPLYPSTFQCLRTRPLLFHPCRKASAQSLRSVPVIACLSLPNS